MLAGCATKLRPKPKKEEKKEKKSGQMANKKYCQLGFPQEYSN
jgi:hypothetical protein